MTARGVRVLLCSMIVGAGLSARAAAATTWLQGRATDQENGKSAASGRNLDLNSGFPVRGVVGGQGIFVLNEVLPGSTDQFCFNAGGLIEVCNETRYTSLTPVLDQAALILQEVELNDWRTQADMLADGTLGQVFGLVRDAAGAGLAGATITMSPASGTLWYVDSTGTLNSTGPTDSSGRFIYIDTSPGDFTLTASVGGMPVARSYGTAADHRTASLDILPFVPLAGTALDQSGNPVAGATVEWDFDGSIMTTSSGSGSWSLTEAAAGLDVTVRGTRSGFREASTFRYSVGEAPTTTAIPLRFFSDADYSAAQAGFGVVQSTTLGMIVGRVLDTLGAPIATASISVDPVVGTVLYYASGHIPDPSLTATSTDGGFIIFNVAAGNVVLSVLAPNFTIRSAVAPSIAGGVTQGDLIAYATQQVSGTVFDEAFKTLPVGGAIVQVYEFPFLSVIVGPDGKFVLDGVPRNTLVSLRAAAGSYYDSYTLRRDTGSAAQRTQDLFLPSDTSVTQLYADRPFPFNRSLATVGVTDKLSNGQGAIGLIAQTVPISGSIGYPGPGSNGNKSASATTIFGNINILGVTAGDGGVLIQDPRSDFYSFAPAPLVPNGVVVDSVPIPCDPGTLLLANIYPCSGAVFNTGAAPADFQWDSAPLPDLGFQVQFSLDPAFGTIDFSSKTSQNTYISDINWRPGNKKWKKILALATGGTPVYWRVEQREKASKLPTIYTWSTPSVFTAP